MDKEWLSKVTVSSFVFLALKNDYNLFVNCNTANCK